MINFFGLLQGCWREGLWDGLINISTPITIFTPTEISTPIKISASNKMLILFNFYFVKIQTCLVVLHGTPWIRQENIGDTVRRRGDTRTVLQFYKITNKHFNLGASFHWDRIFVRLEILVEVKFLIDLEILLAADILTGVS